MKTQNGFFSQFTEQQIKAQYSANLQGLKWMLNKSIETGKKVNGYTELQLYGLVEKYTELAK